MAMSQIMSRFAAWFGVNWPVSNDEACSMRFHTLIGSILAAPIYAAFASVNFFAYDAVKIASVSACATAVAICALLLLRCHSGQAIPGHCFTLALAVQVFGEMALNGGLQAPSAALSLLIVPAAIFTAGAAAVPSWSVITMLAVSIICIMDVKGMLLPANELPIAAEQFDRMFSLVAGIIMTAVLVILFRRQTSRAINTLREERANFRHGAFHDALTGIPNRRYFYEHVSAALDQARLCDTKLTVFYFDIDRFKQINDQHGHAAGDALLIAFAERLQHQISDVDLAARLAGDEFALLVVECDNTIEDQINQLQKIVELPFNLNGAFHEVKMSAGYATCPTDGGDLDTLLRVADERMYENKSQRRASSDNAVASNVVNLESHFRGDVNQFIPDGTRKAE